MKTTHVIEIKRFKAKTTKHDDSPFNQLYFKVMETLKLPKEHLAKMSVSDFRVSAKLRDSLENDVKTWIKKQKPFYTKKMLDQAFGYHDLDIGPSVGDNLKNNEVQVQLPSN